MMQFRQIFFKFLLQLVVWTLIFSIPYKEERLFDVSRRWLIDNQLVQTVMSALRLDRTTSIYSDSASDYDSEE